MDLEVKSPTETHMDGSSTALFKSVTTYLLNYFLKYLKCTLSVHVYNSKYCSLSTDTNLLGILQKFLIYVDISDMVYIYCISILRHLLSVWSRFIEGITRTGRHIVENVENEYRQRKNM